MRFDRIRLHNFKCYGDADLHLDSGVTVIHGLNGSGKSSLLEACFFALYGSKALDETLDEVVTIGGDEMAVELWFTHAGDSYHVERQVRVTDGNARTSKCVLEGPDGTRDGATAVRERVQAMLRMDTEAFVNCAYVRQGEVNKLINASPRERQDMLDDLLQLGALETYRERASDARVGVGRVRDDKQGALAELDDQIREKEAKDLHDQHNDRRSELQAIESDIERFEKNRENARETRDRAESILEEYQQKREELDAVEDDITQLRERIQKTANERERLRERSEECTEKLTALRERREELLAELDEDESELTDEEKAVLAFGEGRSPDRPAVTTAIEAVREKIDGITERIRELSVEKQEHDSEAATLTEQADALEREATEKRTEATELEGDITEARELLAARRKKLEEIGEKVARKREAFEDAPVAFGEAETYRQEATAELTACRERRTERETELEAERDRLNEAQELLEAGKCPECGQPVEESPHVDAIGERHERISNLEEELESVREREAELEDRLEKAAQLVDHEAAVERLESDRDNLTQLLDERETTIEEKAQRIDRLRESADERETEAEKNRERASEAETKATGCQEQIAECNRQKATLSGRRERLAELSEVLAKLADLETERERLQEQRTEKEEVNDERRERLAERRDRREELQESFDADRVEEARQKQAEAAEYLTQVEEKLADLETRRGNVQGAIGALENEIEALEALRERRDHLAETVEHLDSLYDEAETLQEMYGTLRAELRQQNVETLERMLNETFELLYENDTYARIELDGEYRLTVYQKDGEALEPEQLSGGERAIFNLSLRCAIYRLLAEGIEGAAPMPPLILDEPTVFLDEGHVTQLLELIGAMYDLGVDQILVVSHDNELVAAADDLVTVRKDSTTNRSSVTRGSMEELVAAGDD